MYVEESFDTIFNIVMGGGTQKKYFKTQKDIFLFHGIVDYNMPEDGEKRR